MRGARGARTRVAFHPRALIFAIGYATASLLCRLADAAEILVRRRAEAR